MPSDLSDIEALCGAVEGSPCLCVPQCGHVCVRCNLLIFVTEARAALARLRAPQLVTNECKICRIAIYNAAALRGYCADCEPADIEHSSSMAYRKANQEKAAAGDYVPPPLEHVGTVPVKYVGELKPLPYPLDEEIDWQDRAEQSARVITALQETNLQRRDRIAALETEIKSYEAGKLHGFVTDECFDREERRRKFAEARIAALERCLQEACDKCGNCYGGKIASGGGNLVDCHCARWLAELKGGAP